MFFLNPDLFRLATRFSPAVQLQEITVSIFSAHLLCHDRSWIGLKKNISIRSGIEIVLYLTQQLYWKSYDGDFLQTIGRLEKNAWLVPRVGLGLKFNPLWGEKYQLSFIFGAKARANVLKATFSTDCQSDYNIRNGRRYVHFGDPKIRIWSSKSNRVHTSTRYETASYIKYQVAVSCTGILPGTWKTPAGVIFQVFLLSQESG